MKGFTKVFTGLTNFIGSFKKTFSTTTAFSVFMIKIFVFFLFFNLSGRGVVYAFTHMGTLWGWVSVLFFFNLSLWLYIKNLHHVDGFWDAVDGLVASIMTFGFVYLICGLSIFLAQTMSFKFTPVVGWGVFVVSLFFFLFLFIRLHSLYRANSH